ncbi:hypothetical protein V8068_001136 [Vibrio parahaemolyticus]
MTAGKEVFVIQLIEGILPRWADDNLRQTSDKRDAKLYDTEDQAIADFVKIGTNGIPWPFAKIVKVTLRK